MDKSKIEALSLTVKPTAEVNIYGIFNNTELIAFIVQILNVLLIWGLKLWVL